MLPYVLAIFSVLCEKNIPILASVFISMFTPLVHGMRQCEEETQAPTGCRSVSWLFQVRSFASRNDHSDIRVRQFNLHSRLSRVLFRVERHAKTRRNFMLILMTRSMAVSIQ